MIYGGLFDLDNKIKRKEEINEIINDVSFWSTSSKDDVLKEYNSLSNTIDKIKIVKDELIKVLKKYGLPTSYDLKEEDINRYVTKDKKRDGDKIDIVYLEDYEKFSFIKISYEELKEYVKHVR